MEPRLLIALFLSLMIRTQPAGAAHQLDLFVDTPVAAAVCDAKLRGDRFFASLKDLSPRSRMMWSAMLRDLGERMRIGLLSKTERDAKIVYDSIEGLGFLEDGKIPADLAGAAERLLLSLIARIEDLGLAEDEKILPGFLVVAEDGERRVIPFASEVPAGFAPAEAVHLSHLMSSEAYMAIVAKGFQIVQLVQSPHSEITIAQHDIGHLIGLARDAGYMRAVRRIAGERAALFGAARLQSRHSAEAVFYIFELLSHGDRQAVKDYFLRLGVPQGYDCETLECVQALLNPRKAEAQALYREMAYQIMIPYGGAAVGRQTAQMAGVEFAIFDPYVSFAYKGATDRTAELIFHFMQLSKISVENHVARLYRGGDVFLCRAYAPLFNTKTPAEFKSLFCR